MSQPVVRLPEECWDFEFTNSYETKKSALKYEATPRILELAKPSKYSIPDFRPVTYLNKKALDYIASEHILKILQCKKYEPLLLNNLTQVSKKALNYKPTERILKLSQPRPQPLPEPINWYPNIKKAMKYVISERIEKLSKPREYVDLRIPLTAYQVSPKALRYKITERTLNLANPRENVIPQWYIDQENEEYMLIEMELKKGESPKRPVDMARIIKLSIPRPIALPKFYMAPYVSPKAIGYIPTERILKLSKPVIHLGLEPYIPSISKSTLESVASPRILKMSVPIMRSYLPDVIIPYIHTAALKYVASSRTLQISKPKKYYSPPEPNFWFFNKKKVMKFKPSKRLIQISQPVKRPLPDFKNPVFINPAALKRNAKYASPKVFPRVPTKPIDIFGSGLIETMLEKIEKRKCKEHIPTVKKSALRYVATKRTQQLAKPRAYKKPNLGFDQLYVYDDGVLISLDAKTIIPVPKLKEKRKRISKAIKGEDITLEDGEEESKLKIIEKIIKSMESSDISSVSSRTIQKLSARVPYLADILNVYKDHEILSDILSQTKSHENDIASDQESTFSSMETLIKQFSKTSKDTKNSYDIFRSDSKVSSLVSQKFSRLSSKMSSFTKPTEEYSYSEKDEWSDISSNTILEIKENALKHPSVSFKESNKDYNESVSFQNASPTSSSSHERKVVAEISPENVKPLPNLDNSSDNLFPDS